MADGSHRRARSNWKRSKCGLRPFHLLLLPLLLLQVVRVVVRDTVGRSEDTEEVALGRVPHTTLCPLDDTPTTVVPDQEAATPTLEVRDTTVAIETETATPAVTTIETVTTAPVEEVEVVD